MQLRILRVVVKRPSPKRTRLRVLRIRMRAPLAARSRRTTRSSRALPLAALLRSRPQPPEARRQPLCAPQPQPQPPPSPSPSPLAICIAAFPSDSGCRTMACWSRRESAAASAAAAAVAAAVKPQQHRHAGQQQQPPHKHRTFSKSIHTNYANKSNTTYTCYRHNNMPPNFNQNNSNSSHNNNSR